MNAPAPKIGDTIEMTPRQRLHYAARKFYATQLAYSCKVEGVSREAMERAGDALDAAAVGMVTEDLLAKGAV